MKKLYALILFFCSSIMLSTAQTKPNIVMIFADDLHYGALGVTGSHNTIAKTPNIDSIFKNGIRFNNGYATHAVCAPSRAGLMTGRYQARFNFETLPGSTKERLESDYGVDTKETMISEVLQSAGYATCAIGKWHLGTSEKYQPNARGFDHWFGYRGSCGYYQFPAEMKQVRKGNDDYLVKDTDKPRLNIVRNGKSVRVPGYLTESFSTEATEWIKANKEKPFFIYFAPYNVHAPADLVPQKYIPHGGDGHDGQIAALDAAVGEILKALKETKVIDNTIVVFSNDNGGKKIYSTVFRGNKATYYEGGVHVPFAMQWLDGIPVGTESDEMVSTLDMLPTFAAVAGAPLPKNYGTDGKNILPYLNNTEKGQLRNIHFWRNTAWRAVRKGDWKLVWRIDSKKLKLLHKKLGIKHYKGRKPVNAERADELFLMPELYNLSSDIKEQNDVTSKYPEISKELIDAYISWELTLPNHARN